MLILIDWVYIFIYIILINVNLLKFFFGWKKNYFIGFDDVFVLIRLNLLFIYVIDYIVLKIMGDSFYLFIWKW